MNTQPAVNESQQWCQDDSPEETGTGLCCLWRLWAHRPKAQPLHDRLEAAWSWFWIFSCGPPLLLTHRRKRRGTFWWSVVVQRVKESKAPFLKQSRIYFTFDLHNIRRLCDYARAAKLRNYVSVEIILTTLVTAYGPYLCFKPFNFLLSYCSTNINHLSA